MATGHEGSAATTSAAVVTTTATASNASAGDAVSSAAHTVAAHALIADCNSQVALFRDLLIHIGQSKDCPELRERIRKLRRQCVDGLRRASQQLLPQIKSDVAEGIPVDNQHFVLLFLCTQLFHRELIKSRRLVQVIPMDMSGYYENRPGPSNLGSVISQIILCKQLTPDFNAEELCSISKDADDIRHMLADMQEYMPKENSAGRGMGGVGGEETHSLWTPRIRRLRFHPRRRSSFYKNLSSLCCICRPNYL
ncbi:uncharacterized protein LOC124165506 isoform X2 [Ischnura elegans]|uniref:uncharacterized protein LOC124165506 isoform X2 n=1 Tax=Ischnura elegans TaxID=197161 RepID=UPI001ED887AF|nr:uncharacterized protein LOC124165506 isoform X2 [Ischnura elegans]